MSRNILRYLLIFIIIPFLLKADNLAEKLDKLISTFDTVEQEELLNQILNEKPSAETLIAFLENVEFKKLKKKGLIVKNNLCVDGVARPYCLYVPSNYDPRERTPLLVCLHGGVSRKELIEDFDERIKDSPFVKMADREGYILIFPLGHFGATWWDSVGIRNVLQQIRLTKKDFNIDDNRVYMTGFSDGGSGSFLFAMCYPSDFAGFLPLNGHPGVGSEAGEIQTYFINLFNCPIYVVNTDEDELYPAEKEIRPIMELAHTAEADIFYRIYTGIGHDFDYADEEMPRMVKFMETHTRRLSPRIKWESAYPGLDGRWLAIDSITEQGHADWYEDHNMELLDDRVMFGFYPDDNYKIENLDSLERRVLFDFFSDEKYEGPGVKIDKTVGDSTLCAIVGMKEDDIIIKLDDIPINDHDDLYNYKKGKKCGDHAEITVLRKNEILKFEGRFPGPTKYDLFRRGKPSGRIEGYFSANKFSFKTSQVGAFSIFIHPDMVQLDQNVVIEVNGKKVFNEKVKASSEFILRNFLKNRDRELLYVNKVRVTVDSRR
jgi:poly(3-hydroxybutyrate) depolymerase